MSNRYSSAADAYAPLSRPSQNRLSTQGSANGDAALGRARPKSSATNNAWAPDDDGDDDDEEEWNVYDDFNNTRPLSGTPETAGLRSPEYHRQVSQDLPRRSLGGMNREYSSTSSYGTPFSEQPPAGNRSSLLPTSSFGFDVRNGDPRSMEKRLSVNTDLQEKSSKHASFGGEASQSGIELVTVPALGAEFTEEERRKMTRPYKRRSKRGSKKAKFMTWARGENKLFGFLDPRMLVFISFIFCILLGITLFFVIPRQPGFAFNHVSPFTAVPDASGMSIGNLPLNFTMDMKANLRADNTAGWIPSTLTDIDAVVTNVKTYIKVGTGHIDEIKFAGRQKTEFQLPLHFQYVSLNFTGDPTFLDFRNACGAINPGVTRPTLNLQLSISYNIQGLAGRKGTSAQLADIVCPFQLQNYQS